MLYNERTSRVYTRASTIVVNNPMPQDGIPPDIRFYEQDVLVDPDGTMLPVVTDRMDPNGGVGVTLQTELRDTPFDLVHPETGAVVGTAKYQDLELMLYSLYFHAAAERDARGPTNWDVTVDENFMPVEGT